VLIVPKWTSPLEAIRALSVTKESTNHWFLSVVKPLIVDAGIEPHNIYGMDETGFQLGDSGRRRVIGRKGAKRQLKQTNNDRETITSIVTICTDGSVLRPSLIFKGANLIKKWGEKNVANAS